MRSSTIDERFAQLIEKPALRTYLAVREPIVNDSRYDPYSEELRQLEVAVEGGDFLNAREMATRMKSIWRLSPRFHYLTGIAALELQDLEAAEEEQVISRACMLGLSMTGDGSFEQPFLVTYLSDEYDLAEYFEFEIRGQQLVETDDARLDVLYDVDHDECWFDVTDLLAVGRRPHITGSERRHPIARQA